MLYFDHFFDMDTNLHAAYAGLVLNGDVAQYLKIVTQNKQLEN